MQISIQPAAHLCLEEQLALVDKVADRSPLIKRQRAQLLYELDRSQEAYDEISTLGETDRTHHDLFFIASSLQQIDGEDNQNQALELLTDIIDGETDAARPDVLIELGDLYRKRGELKIARKLFLEALDLVPADHRALRKTAIALFDLGLVEELHSICTGLLDAGINHTRLHGTYFSTLAALGRVTEASDVRGFDIGFQGQQLNVPDGFGKIDEFNRLLTNEILAHPAMRFENTRQASTESWRIDELMIRTTPMIDLLLKTIADNAEQYAKVAVKTVQSDPEQLFLLRMPKRCSLRPWSIITREKGYENWHIHDRAWLSGVYYVRVPDGLQGRDGAIEFGWPERLLGADKVKQLGTNVVFPEAGMLLLFPSHIHHRTYPHGMDEDRICVSFDIVPD